MGMFSIAPRVMLGLLLAVIVALVARRARLLSASGTVAAVAVGAICVVAGWGWAVLLLFFFLTSSALSAWRADTKRAMLASMVEKGGERDAVQVLANGAVFTVAAIGSIVAPDSGWYALGAGAIATSVADTWGTEIGTASGGTPRHVLNGAPLPAGASGGVTVLGSVGTVAGAVSAALVVQAVQWSVPLAAVVAGGLSGAFIDSLLGATLQERRRCDACGRMTERRVHSCGSSTRRAGGVGRFGNDAVNLTSVIAGAVVTRMLS